MLDLVDRPAHRAYGDSVPPPLTRQDIQEALADLRALAEYRIGTGRGRALAEADRLLSNAVLLPEDPRTRQGERGKRIRYLRNTHYAEVKSGRGFAKAFQADAERYVHHRSSFDDARIGRPTMEPWLSIARIIELCDGIPSRNTIDRDL